MSRIIYIICGAVVLFGSFFVTLWLTQPESPPERLENQRLENQRISNYVDVRNAAQNVGLSPSAMMQGVVDTISRINKAEVKIEGWLADPSGKSNPSSLWVFMDGSMVATTQTKGERPDVTNALHLSDGAETNVAFSLIFNCRAGGKPIILGVNVRKEYIVLQTKECL
jgi:hypothetical protein